MTPSQERNLVDDLFAARRDGISLCPAVIPTLTDIDVAYRIQRGISERFGDPIVGYKVGSTSVEAQRILGTNEPGVGDIMASFLHDSPARIMIAPAHMPAIEGEFAFRIGSDLPSRLAEYSREEIIEAIDAAAGAVEIVGTRIGGGLAGKGRCLATADGGANIALCVGPWERKWRSMDLLKHPVAIIVNGEVKGQGHGARALGDPLNVMVWLANRLSGSGEGLSAGTIISTGTCTGLDPVEPGDRAVAEFGSLGTVSINFDLFNS